jgi:poly(A) polymerase
MVQSQFHSLFPYVDLKNKDHWSEYSKEDLEALGASLQEIMLAPNCKETLFHLDNARFFNTMIPELSELRQVPQHKQHSKDAFHHSVLVATYVPDHPVLKWAALFHDIGKIHYRTNSDGSLNFLGHESYGAKLAKGIFKRMKIKQAGDICRLIQFHSHPLDYQRQPNWRNETVKRFVDKYEHLSGFLIDLAIADKIASSGQSDYLEPLYTLRHMVAEIDYKPMDIKKEDHHDQERF